MTATIRERLAAAFAPPAALALPFAGADLSTSGVRVAKLALTADGLVLESYVQELFPSGAFADSEISDGAMVATTLAKAARACGVSRVNASLPEAKSYLFETAAPGATKDEWRTAVEQRLDELVPLPPGDTAFDVVKTGVAPDGMVRLAGVGFARRIVDRTLAAYDDAHVSVCALENEVSAMARALLPDGDTSTTFIIDVGKTTTKLAVVQNRIPRFAATVGIGGHALTLAVQKHFGVTEEEARRVKAERGIVPDPGNEDYLEAMMLTVSAIRDEIAKHLAYWQERVAPLSDHEPVTRAILAGGNASVRGLSEYLEGTLRVPVALGDVFTNLASKDVRLPDVDYAMSLAYATAIGLALRDKSQMYA